MHVDLDADRQGVGGGAFDVCIFGTGPAGLTLALDLQATGRRIALVEAGALDYTEASQKLYEGTETGLNTWNALVNKRLRCFGGTSGWWSGRCGLFDEIDFAADTYHGLPGWPIPRTALTEHLAQAVEVLDLGQQDLATRPFKSGVNSSFVQSSAAMSPPTRFGQKYRREIVESRNVHLITNANLVELWLDAPSSSRALLDHALLRNYKGQTFKIRAKRYVVALGAIENARLLLNSDRQMRAGIGNHSGYVGRCYMEHLDVQIGRFVVRDKSYFGEKRLELSPSQSLLQARRIGNCVLAVDPTYVPRDYGRLRHIKRVVREGVCDFETLREYARKFKDFNCVGEGVITSLIEQCPNPESRVSLIRDVDALGLRKVNLHWAINDTDRRTIRTLGMELAKDGSEHIPIGQHAHHMGTTRMSSDPRHGVVDENCKVHGVANLYVAGSSVFPTGGGTNPTLTIVLLALRLGKHLRQLA
jgi:choline dehydrogenase-like flavoprotein